MKLLTACAIVALAHSATALHFHVGGSLSQRRASLLPRGNIAGLNNSGDIAYRTNITLGGKSWSTLIDTGSSDLWVAGTVPTATLTSFATGVNYAVGSIQGPVKKADLQFAGITVAAQAFIEVPPDSNNPEGQGLIGLGPNYGSTVRSVSNGDPTFDPVLDRIFRQNRTTPNYLTVLLGRSDDPTDMFPGDITVGELLPGYEAISSQPQLPVTLVPNAEAGNQHWQILVDAGGVIGPNGKPVSVTTQVIGTSNTQQLTAIFDTGFSLPQVPKVVADAIYSGVIGAQFVNLASLGPVWTVPCSQEINIAFQIGGKIINIHPLDVSLDPSDLGTSLHDSGTPYCIGSFQPVSFDVGSSPTFDIIFGMAFLRNTYLLIDFGDFVAGGINTASPYAKILPTSNDTAAAHSDFVKVRLSGVDNGKMPPSIQPNTSTPSRTSLNRKTIYIIAGAVGGAALLLMAVFLCFCRSKGTKYKPLGNPAPSTYAQYMGYPPNYSNQSYYGSQWPPRQ